MQRINEFSPFQNTYSINLNGVLMDFSTPKIMGVVNLTPDSFFEGSRASTEKEILQHVEKHLLEGADIIDLGAFSSRPFSTPISIAEEEKRLFPSLIAILKEFPKCLISIDTYRSQIARKAITMGASIVNDIYGGSYDPKMYSTVAELGVPYVLMHIKGSPKQMQEPPLYDDVFKEVYALLNTRLNAAREAGIKDVVLDVGFGFGKTVEHNFTLLKNLSYFHSLNAPLLVGISRKKMIQEVINQTASLALNGTTAAHVLALMNGANMLRVHDTRAAKEAILIVDFYQKQ